MLSVHLYLFSLRGINTLSGEADLVKIFYFHSEKGSTLKAKNLLLLGANSFLLEWNLSQKGFCV